MSSTEHEKSEAGAYVGGRSGECNRWGESPHVARLASTDGVDSHPGHMLTLTWLTLLLIIRMIHLLPQNPRDGNEALARPCPALPLAETHVVKSASCKRFQKQAPPSLLEHATIPI